jgi:hypothetical protein
MKPSSSLSQTSGVNLILIVAGIYGCGGGEGLVAPMTGDLQIGAVTTGTFANPTGYQIRVDGGPYRTVGPNATVTVSGLAAGEHEVEIGAIPVNCQLAGTNPNSVVLRGSDTARIVFNIVCSVPTGSIEASIRGIGPAPDSFTLSLDGGAPQTVAAGDTIWFRQVTYMNHALELGTLPNNCVVLEPSPRIVAVRTGPVSVVFTVSCVTPRVATGLIKVRLQTSLVYWGSTPPGGFTVSLDGAPGQPIDANGQLIFDEVTPGSHRLMVAAPPFCGASFYHSNTMDVQVTAGATISVVFSEMCIG